MNSKLLIIGLVVVLMIILVTGYIGNSEITDNTRNNLTTQEPPQQQDMRSKTVEGIDSIHTDNYANTHLEYYYYIPSTITENKQKSYYLLVMIPGLSGRGEHFVTQEFKKFADDENFIIVAPSFIWDEKNWNSRQSYQYPSVWSGDALLEIINKLEKDNDVTVSKFYLFGSSAGAQFALRFCLWKPEMCDACAAHGSGGTVMPDKKVDVKFFVTVGKQDTSRIEKAKTFYNIAQNYGIDVVYKEYDTGHGLTSAQIKDSLDFFKSVN